MSSDGRGIVVGDRIYCQHPKHGVISAPVAAIGKHGVSIPDESGKGHIGVKWGAVLGHQQRKQQKLKVLERGEDGFIAEDESGQRVYVRGGLDESEQLSDDKPEIHKALLLDVGPLSCGCTDHALDELHKAISQDGIEDWAKHESPFIRGLIEQFSRSGLLRSDTVRTELVAWMNGERHIPGLARGAMPSLLPGVWPEMAVGLVQTYLEALPPSSYRLDDWALLIDYMAQRYMAPHDLMRETEALVAKAAMMGKVEAYLSDLVDSEAERVAAALPETIAGVIHAFKLGDVAESILELGRIRACDAVTGVSDDLRQSLRHTVLEHQQRRLAGDATANSGTLEQSLFERFQKFNRDWRMIAVTEAGEMCNQGVIASMPPGSLVRRMEQYHGVCPFCKKLDGRVFRVTTADDPKKDGVMDVWPGKTNIGRSAAPRKRVGNELVPRLESERWWAAAGVQHPHCRGRWEPVRALKPGQDPAFERWMMEKAGIKFGMRY